MSEEMEGLCEDEKYATKTPTNKNKNKTVCMKNDENDEEGLHEESNAMKTPNKVNDNVEMLLIEFEYHNEYHNDDDKPETLVEKENVHKSAEKEGLREEKKYAAKTPTNRNKNNV